jgi:HAD superfamily hydrolase (TIGR01509 family)
MIEGVFFDGDQTLWDFQTLMRRALERTLIELRRLRPGPATDQLKVETMLADRAAVADLQAPGVTLEDLRYQAFARTLKRVGRPDAALAAHLNEYYLRWRFTDVPLYPDVVSTLNQLAGRYRLGLLSNGNGYPERSGLAGVFTVVVFSHDHGVNKPDRRLFDIAATMIGSPASRLVMIGDSLVNDIAGAHHAGWHAIWLNRDHQTPSDPPPIHSVTSLDQLAGMLERVI